jgi:hypothetical protein
MVYDIGNAPEVMYILKEGRLVLETVIEVEDYNKYPVVSLVAYELFFRAKISGKFFVREGKSCIK